MFALEWVSLTEALSIQPSALSHFRPAEDRVGTGDSPVQAEQSSAASPEPDVLVVTPHPFAHPNRPNLRGIAVDG
jgi:hypothetical protein